MFTGHMVTSEFLSDMEEKDPPFNCSFSFNSRLPSNHSFPPSTEIPLQTGLLGRLREVGTPLACWDKE